MFICVEGNIGSGKSTLLNTLAVHFGHVVVKEPMLAWKFWLDNPDCDREFFQCVVLQWYIIVAKKYKDCNKPIYVERSPFTSKVVFSKNLFQQPSQLAKLHNRLYNIVNKIFVPVAYVFLTTPPSLCSKRIQARHQSGDALVTLRLLKHLDSMHWTASAELYHTGASILHLDDC